MLEVSILPFSTIILFAFGNVPTVCDFVFVPFVDVIIKHPYRRHCDRMLVGF